MSLCQEKLNKGWADKYSGKENKIEVDLIMVVRFNILAAALRVAANFCIMQTMAFTPTR